jgi:DNA-binding transcriptional LysR family regulator
MQYLPDLRNIAIFVQVLRHGSFTKAAKQLGFSTNAVSRRVMDLEAELGVKLLVRSTRSLSGTEEGQMLFSLAEKSVEDIMSARHALKTRLESVKGTVRISTVWRLGFPYPHLGRNFGSNPGKRGYLH